MSVCRKGSTMGSNGCQFEGAHRCRCESRKLGAMAWTRWGRSAWRAPVGLQWFRPVSQESSLEIWVCVKLWIFQAALNFTREVWRRELIGGSEMKLGQRSHQVLTKHNFSSFTVLSWKRPVLKPAHRFLTPTGVDAKKKKKVDLHEIITGFCIEPQRQGGRTGCSRAAKAHKVHRCSHSLCARLRTTPAAFLICRRCRTTAPTGQFLCWTGPYPRRWQRTAGTGTSGLGWGHRR